MDKIKSTKNSLDWIENQRCNLRTQDLEYCQNFADLAQLVRSELGSFQQINDLGVLNFEQQNGKVSLSIEKDPENFIHKISESARVNLLKDLKHMLMSYPLSSEYKKGLHYIDAADNGYVFFILEQESGVGKCFVINANLSEEQKQFLLSYVQLWQLGSHWLHRIEEAQRLVYVDDLTGLYNYRYYEFIIESEIRRANRFNSYFSLLFIDLDNFKSVNDNFGHLNGSLVLKQVANVLRKTLREVDSIIRYGGDEFVIVLIGATPSRAFMVAERIRKAIEEEKFKLDTGATISVTSSIGIASYPTHAKNKSEILSLADQSMYYSKKHGKNKTSLIEKPI